ncbi:GEVED domain-containing protein [Leucothrix mucor]|uniref:GEVED domain-containing protein n=1 Tax=Leucothrix mucor TaxID=45248 RepID=UPI00146B4B2F|nr:GEVED domain-containing protein [Leucothrix mucor]
MSGLVTSRLGRLNRVFLKTAVAVNLALASASALGATTPFESYCLPPASINAAGDAISWLDDGLSIYTIGNNTNALGYRESGFQDVVAQMGGTLTTLNGNSDYSFTGNTGSGSAVNSVGTFDNGTMRFSTDYVTTNLSQFRTTTAANFFSGETGNGVYIFPEQGGTAGDSYTVSIDFTTPVNAFSFDLIDIFDTLNLNSPVLRYEIYADGELVAYLKGPFLGDDLTGSLTLVDGNGTTRGTVTAGQNIENTLGFIASSPVSNVSIKHIVESGTIDAGARDPHGLDTLSYSTDIVCVKPADYGDAPDSYGDASHSIEAGVQLGVIAPDQDAESQNLANGGAEGTGDDLDGTDDEDGVVIPPLTLGVATVVSATVSGTNGKLQAWIDWNGDGDFADLGEQLLTNVQDNGVGDTDLTLGRIGFAITPALSSTVGTTYARFRWSSDLNVASTGLATNGEVEDYEITLLPSAPASPDVPFAACQASDFTGISPDGLEDRSFPRGYWAASYYQGQNGFASSSYGPTNGSGGSGAAEFRGEAFWGTGENPVQTSSNGTWNAIGTWSNGGETPTSPSLPHPSYVGSTWSDSNAYYQIDYRRKIDLAGVIRIADIADSYVDDGVEVYVNGVRQWATHPPSGGPNGWISQTNPGQVSVAANDEVLIRFINLGYIGGFHFAYDLPGVDCSDTPTSGTNYGTASHIEDATSALYLGSAVDDETASIASANADGDGSDDDGIDLPKLTAGLVSSYSILSSDITAAGTGTLHAWIDFDGNGTFDADEHSSTSVSGGSAAGSLIWTLDGVGGNPNFTLSAGDSTFARFRLTSDTSVTASTPASGASDGEVEDYVLAISAPDVLARPTGCGVYNHAGWLTNAGPYINKQILFGSGDQLRDPYAYANFGKDADGRIITSFGLPNETLSGSIPGKAGTELSEIAVGEPGQKSEYHLTVFRLDGKPGTTDTVKFTSVGGADNIYAWIEDSAGNVLTHANEFIYSVPAAPEPQDGDGEELPLTFTYPADGVVYLYGSLFDPSSYYGKTTVEDYTCPSDLSGVVFEDINYGGGAGRDQASASGVGVNGVTVELYDDTGAYVSSTTTVNDGSTDGTYKFETITDGDYFVRIVNDTVGSTRGGANGSELAVQTFRTDGTTAVTNEVGGRNPAIADDVAYDDASPSTLNTSTFVFTGGTLDGGEAQSLQPITMAGADLTEVDFGFNFDTIVNTNDAGQGSLRQFILNSNLLDNTGLDQVDNAADGATDPAAGVETSIFEIPGSGVQVIEPTTGLPAVTDSFTALDATTQQGASCVAGARTLQVQLDGSNAGVNEQGISIDASDAIIRGFAIGEFSEQGIHGSANADNLVVACNNVGLAADGSTLATNGLHGIWIEDATNITIGGSTDTERNIVSGNTRHGINLDGVNGATVQFNYVGTDESGDSARTNNNEGAQYGGVAAIASATNISILDNLISGNDKISGTSPINATDGIYLYAANTIDIKRNLIGTRADGLAALSNSGHGIYSFNTKNIVVGGSVADRNVISGNGEDGINTRFGTDTVSILSNYIGVAINGTSELGNTDNGIFLADTANAIIGDGTVAGRNVIAGNDISGVRISASGGTTVKGNYIGVDATGMSAIGNSLHGVYVQNSADVVVGGSAANDRNVVSGNGVIGVYMVGATSDTRVENNVVGLLSDGDTIAANGGAGIETSGTNGVVIHDNVASGNGSRGVHLVNSPNTTVTNNLIGLNEAGTADRGNTSYGIDVDTAAVNLAVNGNTIAGNGSTGIRIINGDATNNVITNNRIGVALDGTTGMGNTNGGVLIQSTSGVTVGGSAANESNIIAYNTGDAITVLSSGAKNNTVSRNVMYANTGLGIDLDQDNVTLNDAGDSDSGAGNDGLNFPQFSQITLISGNLTVAGCAPAGATVELFEADVSPTSGSGVSAGSNAFGKTQDYGEGEVFLTAWTMPASGTACALPADADGNDSTGMLAFSQTFALSSLPAGASIVLDDKLTAIATLAGTGTSEFSAIGLVASFDYGDAPLSGTAPSGSGNNNYGITQHAVVSGMSLGSSDPDIDASYQDSALADGDDVNGADDEDGILLPALVAGDTQYSIVSADITAVGSGTLHAWIDFDGNGTFDADEHSSTAISSGTAGTLSWTMDGAGGNPDFSLAGASTTFARFRFTSDASITASTPASIAANGEVEDYAMTILDNTPDVMTRPGVCGGFVSRGWATDAAGILHDNDIRFNSGSAQNDPYAFLALRRQANGKIVTSFGDPDLLETLTGSIPTRAGNNLITTARTDSGHRSEYHATIFRLEGTPGATETVNYDTNGGAEYSAYWVEDAAGNVLSAADFVYTYASGGGIGESFDISVTYPTDGVVYVYSVLFDPTQAYGRPTLLNYTCPTDYSDGLADGLDTPNGTVTASAYGDATHQLLPGIQLGASVTADTASVLAADDASDDAIASFPLLSEAMTSYQIKATDIVATGDGTLSAWIDFDGDGAYQADELATAEVVAGVVQADLDWAFTDIMAAGTSYARFRLTSDTLVDVAGTTGVDERATLAAIDGEVEDYPIPIVEASKLNGIVFEDINYGGGAGRDQASASGVGVNGVTVELYDNTGAFIASTTTANDGTNDGAYEFAGLINGDYHVRVVSDTISSTRSGADGSELAVQTFRTDGTTPVTAEVGGRQPALSDGTAYDIASPSVLNTTSYAFTGGTLDGGQSQSVTPVTLVGADITGIDFGFNFDTIVNTNDAGQGSLRQFILNSNLLTDIPNQNINAGQETSIFMIPDGTGYAGTANHGALDLTAGGLATIATGTGFDAITDHFTALDASTQNGASCSPRTLKVVLDGSSTAAGSGIDGFTITGNNATVRGFSIGGYDRHGINLSGDDALLVCNHVGLDAAGTTATPNTVNGINVSTSVNVQIGDGSAAGMNVLSGNTEQGLFIGVTGAGIVVDTNHMGTTLDGQTALPNGKHGIFAANISTAGATLTVQNNVSSGNTISGLYVINSENLTLTTTNNLLGMAANGTTTLANGGHGLHISGGGTGTFNATITNNTLSGNTQNGVWIANSRMINITNNRIGVDTAGNSAGNNSFGIRILNSADITIGDGTAPGSNIIANNGSDGLYVDGATDAVISRNSLYSNGGLGIDLVSAAADVTLNDANDADTGPNGGLNFPQLTRVVYSGSDLIIQGCAPTGSTVELFEADVSSTSSSGATAGDNSFGKTQDYGEGEVYITSFEEGVDEDSTLAAVNCSGLSDADGNDATGMSPFQWRMALPAGLQVGDKLTATATLTGTGTSEFSAVAIIAGQDYGDAPSRYNTTLASDGARHDVINNVYLGSVKPDVDSDGQPSTAANSDGADEDGIASFGALTISDSSYSVVARVNNSTSNTATLIAWIDFDGNGRFDADEAAIRTVSAGASGSDITLNWSSIPLDIKAGDTYLRVRLTTDSLNNREPDGPKLDGEVEDYPITITTVGVTVSGRVFNDANVNAANDSGEVGVTQLPVVLYDTVNKVCVSTRTDGSGAYAFEDVVPGTYQVYEASRESVPVPRNCGPAFAKNPGSYRSTMDNVREAFIVTTSDITGQDFGDVKLPVFEPDNTGQVLPGNVLFYAHKFTTPAKGSVSFSSVSSGNKSSGWSSIIYRDANCDGTLNQSDGAVPLGTGSLAVDAADNICLINKVYAPANVAANDQYVQNITADFDFENTVAGTLALIVRDVTTALQVVAPALPATPEVVAEPVTPVQAPVEATPTTPYIPETEEVPAQAPVAATPVTPTVGPSRLELRKTVRNISTNSGETDTVNTASPGDILEYRIYYSNTGTGPLTDLVVNDLVPAYTELDGALDCGGVLTGMSCTTSPVGLNGSLQWNFTGAVLGGAGSSVSYRVVIDE